MFRESGPLDGELLTENTFLETVAGIEHEVQCDVTVFPHLDLHHIAHFGRVGYGTDGAFELLQRFESDPGVVWQDGAAPAAWPKGADWR